MSDKTCGQTVEPGAGDFYFIPYGEGEHFHAGQAQFRRALAKGEIPVVNIDDTEDAQASSQVVWDGSEDVNGS